MCIKITQQKLEEVEQIELADWENVFKKSLFNLGKDCRDSSGSGPNDLWDNNTEAWF